MQVAFSSEELSAIVQPRQSRGRATQPVSGIAALDTAGPGDLSFLGNSKYTDDVASTRAGVVLVPKDYAGEPREGQLFLLVDNPSLALGRICARVEQRLWPRPAPGVHPTACIAPGATVAASATVGPLCVIEDGASVGERTHLQAQVFLGRGARVGADGWLMPGSSVAHGCVLKDRVRLQPGAVVGSDGFGYEFTGGRHEKLPQIGNVVVEDDVEIGAHSTVDRARFSSTVVGEGTKLDNLVQVAHNVLIGKHCMICAQTGISGSTVLEDFVVMGGQVGTVGHVRIGKGSNIAARSGVSRDLPAGSTVWGTPAVPLGLEKRLVLLRSRLPEFLERLGKLEKREKA